MDSKTRTPQRIIRIGIIVAIAMALLVLNTPPVGIIPVSAQGGSCSAQIYDASNPTNWVFKGYTSVSPCPCPPTEAAIRVEVGGSFRQFTCSGSPGSPPDKPSVNAGPSCLAGDSRTVTLGATGDSHRIEISTGGVVDGTGHTFTGLVQGVAYSFRGIANNNFGDSGWSDWAGPVFQDMTAPTTQCDHN